MVNAQSWLDKNYPEEQRSEIKDLDVKNKSLTGSLNLTGFVNLKKFDCSSNKLSSLDCLQCIKLQELNCSLNSFASLQISDLPSLKKLYC